MRITAEQTITLLKDKLSFAGNNIKHLESELQNFKRKCSMHRRLGTGFMLYGLMVTVFAGIKNQVFIKDMASAFIWVRNVLIMLIEKSYETGNVLAARTSEMVMKPLLKEVVYRGILCAVTGGIAIIVLLLLFLSVKWIVEKYREYCMNLTSLAVTVLSLAVCVFFGKEIKMLLPVNLLLFMIMIQLLNLGIQWYVSRCRQYRGY